MSDVHRVSSVEPTSVVQHGRPRTKSASRVIGFAHCRNATGFYEYLETDSRVCSNYDARPTRSGNEAEYRLQIYPDPREYLRILSSEPRAVICLGRVLNT